MKIAVLRKGRADPQLIWAAAHFHDQKDYLVSYEISFALSKGREAQYDDKRIVFFSGTELSGQLTLEPSDGPFDIREYQNHSYVATTFDFDFGGERFRSCGLLSQWHLWAVDSTNVQVYFPEFRDEIGEIDGMMDERKDWTYVLPDGTIHTNRLKHTACHFGIMVQHSALLVRCRYYDQNPDICDHITIFYSRSFDDLLLLNDMKLYYDESENLEDFDLNGADTITLQKI